VLQEFKTEAQKELYQKLISLMLAEATNENREVYEQLYAFVDDLKNPPNIEKTIVHNDFNPRNVAIRNDGSPCIYDWELAMINFPHRDVIEFLAFVLPETVSSEELVYYLDLHFQNRSDKSVSWEVWKKGYEFALKEFMVTRVTFYSVGSILLNYGFVNRLLKTSFKIINLLKII
jgi:hydroxymethylglutaryl-CoA reductase (NADPH)